MLLPARALVAGLLVAVPVAALAGLVLDRTRARDLELALARVVRSQVNDQVRERCESDPRWFLTGPLDGRPRGGDSANFNPDGLPARPRVTPQPFELFAYDEDFIATSPAAPRFPTAMRNALRAAAPEVSEPYVTPDGDGVQVALPTNWIGGPCAYFLGRMAPRPDESSLARSVMAGAFLVALVVGLAAAAPLILRVRRLSELARAASNDGFTTVAPGQRRDELNAVAFVYNDAANELQLRRARIDDLEAALRRHVLSTDEDVVAPLRSIEAILGAGGAVSETEREALRQAHDVLARVENLSVAAKLRMAAGVASTGPVDLNALAARVVARHEPVARTNQVSLSMSLSEDVVTVAGDAVFVERAVANLVDNAVRHNRPGGTVVVALAKEAGGSRFRLCVTDTGPGVTAEAFKALTAIRRFRGDEHRNRRPGAPGLGLAVAREVADRHGLQLDLRRPAAGGFEAEISGPVS
jgi:signal transduction histidine kinase